MASEKHIPSIVWAQRNDKLYVTINVEDCKNLDIKFVRFIRDKTERYEGLTRGTSGQKIDYDFTLELFGDIDTEKSKYAILQRHIPMVIVKKESGPYWPQLLKETTKVHWLKTDFDKWKDEDDSDVDDSKDLAFEDMMGKMGDLNGGFGNEEEDDIGNEEDSDDEELPDLE